LKCNILTSERTSLAQTSVLTSFGGDVFTGAT